MSVFVPNADAHRPLTRKRTHLFTTFRQQHKSFSRGGDVIITINASPQNSSLLAGATPGTPKWVLEYEIINMELNQAGIKMEKLRQLHDSSLRVEISTSASSRRNEQLRIEQATQEITTLYSSIQSRIKKLSVDIKQAQMSKRTDEFVTITNIQQASTLALQKLTQRFRTDQQRYLDAVKMRAKRANELMGELNSDDPELLDYTDKGFTLSQSKRVEMAQRDVIEREQQLRAISTNVVQISELMKEIGRMVTVQGSLLDRIDYNIANAESNIEKGVKELESAEQLQKKNQNKMFIILLIISIFCFSVLLLMKVTT